MRRRLSGLRFFISLNPPPEIISRLRDQQTFLRERLDERYRLELSVRWTKPAQFHLTLLFLGNLFWQQLERIQRQIAETVAAAKTRNSRSQKLQEFRSCRMGRRLSDLGIGNSYASMR